MKSIETGRLIVKEKAKHVVKAIEPNDVIVAFLNRSKLDEPLEYFKVICLAATANYPMYYSLAQAKERVSDAIKIIEGVTTRGITTKRGLIERLQGKTIKQVIITEKATKASTLKAKYREMWNAECIVVTEEELNYCFEALQSLDDEEIKKHEEYIRKTLLELYRNYYEKANPNVITKMRKSICRVDEVLYLSEVL